MPTVAELSVDVEITGVTEALAELDRLDERLRRLGEQVADASVDVNTDKAIAEVDDLEAKLTNLDNDDVTVPVEINDGAAMAHVVQLRAALDALTKKVTTSVDLDIGKALAQIQTFRSMLVSLGNANVAVDLDIGGALAHLAALEAALKAIPDETVTVEVDKDGGGKRGLDALTQYALRASNQVGLLATAIIGLGPAAITAGAVAAGGIGVLSASLVGATAGVAVFGLAFLANFQGIKNSYDKLIKAEKDYRLAVTNKDKEAALQDMRDAYLALDPAQRQVLGSVMDLRETWKQLAQDVRNTQFTMVIEAMTFLADNLPRMRGFLKSVADAFLEVERNAIRALTGNFWSKFFSDIGKTGADSLKAILTSIGNVIEGVAGMIDAFMPFTASFNDGMVQMTEKFKIWGTTLAQNPGFKAFIDYVRANLPNVLGFIKALWDALIALAEAAAPIGAKLVPALSGVLNFIVKLNETNPNLLTLALAIGGVVLAVLNLLGPLLTIFKTFSELGAVLATLADPVTAVIAVIGLLVGALILAWNNSTTFRNLVTQAWKAVQTAVETAWPVIVSAMDTIRTNAENLMNWAVQTFGPAFGAVWQFILGEAQKFRDWWAADGQQIQTDIDKIFANVQQTLKDFATGFQIALQAVKQLWDLFWPGLSQVVQGEWTIIQGIVSNALGALRGLVEIFIGFFSGDWSLVWSGVELTFVNWASWVASWGQGLSQIFSGIWTILGTEISTAWSTIWTGVGNQTYISWDGIITLVQGGTDTVLAIMQSQGQLMLDAWTAQWNLLGPPVTAAFQVVGIIVATNMSILVSIVQGGFQALASIWGAEWVALSIPVQAAQVAIGAILGTAFLGWQQMFQTFGTAIQQIVQTTWTNIQAYIQTYMGNILATVGGQLALIWAVWDLWWNQIFTLLVQIWQKIVQTVQQFMAQVLQHVATGGTQMNSSWSTIWANMVATVGRIAVQIIQAIQNLISQAVGVIAAGASLFFNAGLSLIQGLANGILAGTRYVITAMAEVTGLLSDPIPGSPAKTGPLSGQGYVLLRGQRMMADLATGIQNGIPNLGLTMDQTAGTLASGLPSTNGGFAGITSNSASTVIQVASGAVQLVMGPGANADSVQGALATGGDDLARQILMRLQRL